MERLNLIICIVGLVCVSSAIGATLNVPSAAYPTIQSAIDAAVDGDTVILSPGMYNETINFNGKAITLRSSDGPDGTIIDGTGLNDSVVKCISGEGSNTVLDGFTISGGSGSLWDTYPYLRGGGMLIIGSSPTILNCIFSGNGRTNDGGGIWCDGSSPTISNCIIRNNSGGHGGGIGCWDKSNPNINNCIISANDGGGIWCYASSNPIITHCTINDNDDGGIYCGSFSSPRIFNCIIKRNYSGYGGGINCFYYSHATITNCTITRNSAYYDGGGVCSTDNSSPTITNSILLGNMATHGNEIALRPYNFPSSTISVNYTDSQGGSAAVYVPSDCTLNWGEGNIDADPCFVDADNNDFHLLPDSPCIDAGDNEAVPPEITTDLDGNPRFVDDPNTVDTGNGIPPIVDMGAFETWIAAPPEPPLMVEIDIKPGIYPNAINLGSHGLIPVAILSSDEFDATTVDPDTVELAGANIEVKVKGKSNKYMAHEDDVDRDGLIDLVVQVATANLDPESLQDGWAVLTGTTYDGQNIEGWDEITIVPTK